MTLTLQLLLLIGLIILAAKSGGYVSMRLGQPAVLGELLIGLVLGPSVLAVTQLPIFASGHAEEIVIELGELGVIFLMFVAGLEVDLEEMLRAGKAAILVGVLGVVAPLLLAIPVAQAFGYALRNAMFIGIILTATSVSISAQTLLELGALRSKEGLTLLGAAVVDDVLVILVLSIFLALTGSAEAGIADVVVIVLRMGVFLTLAVALGVLVLPRLARRVEGLPVSEGLIALVVVVMLLYAWLAEVLGAIAAITGAFLAGLFFARTAVRYKIERGMHVLSYAFFVPIFLVTIGLKADARTLGTEEVWFTLAIIVVAIVGKVVGCWLGARASGLDSRESLRVGIGMVSRGEVGLIVAGIGLSEGLINRDVFSVMVVMVLATTLVTPIFLRGVFPKREAVNG